MTSRPAGFPVVALVCSAGGFDALIAVLEPLPREFGAAVVALQHLPPESDAAILPDLLAGRIAMPVHAATDGGALTPGTVHVAPPGSHVLITADARTALIESGGFPPNRPSADLLLVSLALAVGDRAIAVVLSGTGTDGATGATAIHRFGGMVLASNEASSTAFSMPSASLTRSGAASTAVPLHELPGMLTGLVGPARGSASASPEPGRR